MFPLPMSLWFSLNTEFRSEKLLENKILVCAEMMTGNGIVVRRCEELGFWKEEDEYTVIWIKESCRSVHRRRESVNLKERAPSR